MAVITFMGNLIAPFAFRFRCTAINPSSGGLAAHLRKMAGLSEADFE
jgi:hypothetical protein